MDTDLLKMTTDKGIGGYSDSVSYKLANGDLTRKQVAEICGVDVDDVPVVWGWDEHESLVG